MTDEASRLQGPADVAERVDALTAEFPGHSIAAEYTAGNALRWIARNRTDAAHPRLVITHDAAELRDALAAG